MMATMKIPAMIIAMAMMMEKESSSTNVHAFMTTTTTKTKTQTPIVPIMRHNHADMSEAAASTIEFSSPQLSLKAISNDYETTSSGYTQLDTIETSLDRKHSNGSGTGRRSFLSKVVSMGGAAVSGVVLSSLSLSLDPLPVQALDTPSPVSSSSPSSSMDTSNTSTPAPAVDPFASFGQELNAMDFNSWNTNTSDGSSGSGTGNDSSGDLDFMKAVEEKQKKRAVGPRTHG